MNNNDKTLMINYSKKKMNNKVNVCDCDWIIFEHIMISRHN